MKRGYAMTDLKNIRLFLLDMDGTIYLDDDLFDGTMDFLNYVRNIGGRYMFLTNNSSKSVDKYVEKLAKLGISATTEDFLTSTNATVLYLQGKKYHKIRENNKKMHDQGKNVYKSRMVRFADTTITTDPQQQ